MNTSWRSAIVALVGLAAVAWLGFDRERSADSFQIRNDCNSQDPLSDCATGAYFGYPIGDGLVITLDEEFL
jgi:hypothetical protein